MIRAAARRTLASPVGLAAWILEKFLTWSEPATRSRLTADDLITTVMIYWVTQTIGSSIRLYVPPLVPFSPDDLATVPASVLTTREPGLPVPPPSWLRRTYPNLTRLITLEEGGHFLALESPQRFVAEIRDAFRPYRGSV